MGSWTNSLFGSSYGIGSNTLEQYGNAQQQAYAAQANSGSQQALIYNQLVYQIMQAQLRRRRQPPPQPPTNFGAYEQKHRAIQQDSTEDEGMREGFTGMLNTFLVGCDPEFVALNARGEQINVSPFFTTEEIGYDHGGRVGEFRPEPTKGTYALTKKLQRLIKSDVVGRVGAAKLRAGARIGRDTLGGHVHLGFPVPRANDGRISALDRVTDVLEKLDILPQAECSARRGAGAYGRFGDARDSNGHMEYRTMASWLHDPRVAYLCLTAAKLAACDPKGTVDTLPAGASFNALVEWFRSYRSKDINARRALERVLSLGHKPLQVYPDVDFRERWRELGL
jgi:hypothetical protein